MKNNEHPDKLPVGATDNSDACRLQVEFTSALSDLSQRHKLYYVRQAILDLMDYTEQSEEEKIWCNLLIALDDLDEKNPRRIKDEAERMRRALEEIIEEEQAQHIRCYGLGDIAREALRPDVKGQPCNNLPTGEPLGGPSAPHTYYPPESASKG